MEKIDRAVAERVAYESDLEISAVRTYSGRGMYGRECFGLDVSSVGDAMVFAVNLAAELEGDTRWLADTRTDDMGRGMIVYWPNVELVGDSWM